MKIDFSPLASAVDQLQRSFDYLHSELASTDPGLREQFRSATIQAFEFTYELAVKMVQRQWPGSPPIPTPCARWTSPI